MGGGGVYQAWGVATEGAKAKRWAPEELEGVASLWDLRRAAKTSGSTPPPFATTPCTEVSFHMEDCRMRLLEPVSDLEQKKEDLCRMIGGAWRGGILR